MSEEFKVQWSVSLPPAAQYAKGDMLNLRGVTVEEVEAQLDAILAPDSEFMQKATEAAAQIRAAATLVNPAQEAPQAASAGPVQTSRTCAHGNRERREGGGGNTGKRAWVGWFCSLPKGSEGQCKAEFE